MQTGKESKFQNCLYSEVGSSRRGCCCCHFTQRNKEISLELLPALLRLSFLSRRRSSSTPCIRQGLSSCRRRSWNVRTQPSFCKGFAAVEKSVILRGTEARERSAAELGAWTEPVKQSENKWQEKEAPACDGIYICSWRCLYEWV